MTALHARLFRKCIAAPDTDTRQWKEHLLEADLVWASLCQGLPGGDDGGGPDGITKPLAPVVTSNQIETAARMFSWLRLHESIVDGFQVQERPVDNQIASIRQQLEAQKNVFLEVQVSEGFHNRYTDFVYQHWLSCGLVQSYMRSVPNASTRTALVTMVNHVLSIEERNYLRGLLREDVKVVASEKWRRTPPPDSRKQARGRAAPLNPLLCLLPCLCRYVGKH